MVSTCFLFSIFLPPKLPESLDSLLVHYRAHAPGQDSRPALAPVALGRAKIVRVVGRITGGALPVYYGKSGDNRQTSAHLILAFGMY